MVIATGIAFLVMLFSIVFVVIPVGLVLPSQQDHEYAAWRKAQGYEI